MSKIDTICVQGAYEPKNGEPRVLPIYQNTTFCYDTPEQLADVFNLADPGYMYTRLGNPTTETFAKKIAMLEGGVAGVATSSGQAASHFTVVNVCNAGDNIIAIDKIYGGTFNLFNVTLRKMGIETRFVDSTMSTEEIEKLIDDKTKLIFGETLANPAMEIFDFDKFSAIAKKHKILLAIDNTLATPYICRPIEKGANIVLHSTTKYIDGHATCVGGVIVCADNFDYTGNPRYPMMYEPDPSYHGVSYQGSFGAAAFCVKITAQLLRDYGSTMSPFNAWLTNLGAETLALRMQKHCDNANYIANKLKDNKNVEWIKYAGIDGDAEHEKAVKYFDKNLYGAMITFGVKGGKEGAVKFQKALKLIKIVTHIADTRTCVLHPATTTHRQLTDEQLKNCGITNNLIRLSVGIEDANDILADIENALAQV